MLVLTRRQDELVVITDKQTREQIVVTVLKTVGGNVQLGFEAAVDRYSIHREEVQMQIDGGDIGERMKEEG
jgi:carbon storage regulator CsrA